MMTKAERKQISKIVGDAERDRDTAARYRRALTEIAALADEGSMIKRTADMALRELTPEEQRMYEFNTKG